MDTGRNIRIMGIVNLTDDSYYANSRCLDRNDKVMSISKALARATRLVEEGATIIDLGACSTRPGAESIGAKMEWERLEGPLREIWLTLPQVKVSVDTWWSEVVERCCDMLSGLSNWEDVHNRFIVNDISSGEDDADMLPLVGREGLSYIAMHKKGNSKTMQSLCHYENVTLEVVEYFKEFSRKAEKFGIRNWILDPGFGFAKDIAQNYQLLRESHIFKEEFPNQEILVGVSRKSMIYKLFDTTPEDSLAQTQVLHMKALQNGADILRVHDVEEAARTVRLYSLLG
ncbi:MAG: dihydropteroate synthase [Candidatus Cryptobacteroides sp.]|nr:dihydropteroate synthase [Candidatus Cryptobacteroides sp.]